MEAFWFCMVAIMIAGYVVLDGFDLGAGALQLILGKTHEEREQVISAIGPFWDGNEVWLMAGGGTLFFAFPTLYASAFAGFYLPLMIVLWLLILRGIGIEMRHQIHDPMWISFWDVVFSLSSALLAVFFGAALGNVVRGVPLNKDGEFFLPLWTNFQPGADPGILDWYTVLVGLLALAALLLHGAYWIAYRAHSPVEDRALHLARPLYWVVLLLTVAVTAASVTVRPGLFANYIAKPWGILFPAVAVSGLVSARRAARPLHAFAGTCFYLLGMLTSAAFSLFPSVLPAPVAATADYGLTVYNAAAPGYGLGVGLLWWIPGFFLAGAYTVFVYRKFAGKVDKPAATENEARG